MPEEAWYYFLSIEKDFNGTIDFVHLSPANAKAYSNEYAKLILLIGSEVDVIAKRLCKKVSPHKRAKNIDDYRQVITKAFPGERDKKFEEANQENTLNALCGLFALLLYLFKDEEHLQPYPDLLDHGFPSYIVTEGGKKLPGT
jgi:hypothetical protein